MKRTFSILLLILLVTYAKEGYELVTREAPVKCSVTGSLSDVADEVIAIPLETNTRCILSHAKLIKRDRDNLFLLSNGQLYHFNCSGKFINQITYSHPSYKNNILISDYVIDPVHQQLIVTDDRQNVHYYNYEREFLGKINLSENHLCRSLGKLAYYDNHIWATVDRTIPREEYNNQLCVEQWLYKFDTTFHAVEARKLAAAELGRLTIGHMLEPEVAVANRQVYVLAPSLQPDLLLHDTLYLISQNKLNITDDYSSILPLRIGSRFLVSTHYNPNAEDKCYTFCYDRREDHAYNVQGGLDDNFYGTGRIPELQAMDVYSNSYCYSKSSEEVKQSFPDRKAGDNPVIFIVKLKA